MALDILACGKERSWTLFFSRVLIFLLKERNQKRWRRKTGASSIGWHAELFDLACLESRSML